MTGGNFCVGREIFRDLWLFVVIITTILALLINILSFSYGTQDVAFQLLYIPVIIAAYWYPHRSPVFAGIISLAYLGIVYSVTQGEMGGVIASAFKCFVLIGVSIVISGLAIHMRKNDAKYQEIFSNTETGFGLVNLTDLSITEVNKRFAEMLGYSRDELTKISFADLWLEPAAKETFFTSLVTQENVHYSETRFKSRINGERWVLVSARTLVGKKLICSVIDITDRKKAEEELLIKAHAINSSINAIAILDLDFTTRYVNRSLLTMMDYHQDEKLSGIHSSRFFGSQQVFDTIREELPKEGRWFGEVSLVKNNKTPIFVQMGINMVNDETGKPICIMASFIDITDRRQMDGERRKALEEIGQNIEQFAILGDHIRNPLAVIMGLSSLAPGEITDKIILQSREIDRIITQLDAGWVESDKVREFIKRYYKADPADKEQPYTEPKKKYRRP
ncbi:MAG: PAS domain S-box protein [Methanoregula sp.]